MSIGLSDVAAYIGALFAQDDLIEVRLIWPKREDNKPTPSEWVPASTMTSDLDLHARLSKSNAAGWGIYVGANPRKAIGGRDAASVALARALFVDFDGGTTTDDAIRIIHDAGLPAPTLLVDSGHGAHAYWRLDNPMTDLAEWTGTMQAMISRLHTDNCIHDSPRVMRLPGFTNTKAPAMPCRLIEAAPTRVYSLIEFPNAAVAPIRPQTMSSNGSHRELSKRTLDFAVNGAMEKRNARLFAAAVDFNGCGYSAAEAQAKLIAPAVGSPGDHPFTEAEALTVIASAYSKPRTPSVRGDGDSDGAKVSQANALIALMAGSPDVELFHNPSGDAFASVIVSGHRETWPIRSKGFRHWAGWRFYMESGKGPGGQAMEDALNTISAKAVYDGAECRVFLRIAEHKGAIYLDLCDDQWCAVRIDPEGWAVVPSGEVPVRFVRKAGMEALPEPVRGGRVDELRPLVNLPDDDQWTVVVGWLVGAFRPRGPYAVLGVTGEQGSAKSCLCRFLRG